MRPEVRYEITLPVQRPSGLLTTVQFLGALALAICFVPAGAHLAELANKLVLPPEEYMTVQQIYRGWALFGGPVVSALLLTLVHTILIRRDRWAAFWSFVSFLCMAATQAVFWLYTFPLNARTSN